ncbi:MAG: ATP synthase epsilon chain [Parcubacteria group bacterium GW2011_GWA2_51_10]|nr:MAG: ATP synthase epsilon chain [Parcubacteria group bacterium GW2011_GWA2_51_10]
MATFHLTISSVGQTHFDGEARSATFPGADGEFTILPKHEPFISTLSSGTIIVRPENGETQEFSNDNGVLECSSNKVVVLL